MRLSTIERRILDCVQTDIPLASRPFRILSRRLNIGEKEFIEKLKALKDKVVIRSFSIGLNHARLGFRSTLVGLRVSDDKVESIARAITRYPEVTHCFLREGDYNLWSVFIYSRKERLNGFLNRFAKRVGRGNILNLPTKKKFKLRTRLKV